MVEVSIVRLNFILFPTYIKIGFRNADNVKITGLGVQCTYDERLGIRQAAMIDSVIRSFG